MVKYKWREVKMNSLENKLLIGSFIIFNLIVFLFQVPITHNNYWIIKNIFGIIWFALLMKIYITIIKTKSKLIYFMPIYCLGEIYRVFYIALFRLFPNDINKIFYEYLSNIFYAGDLLFTLPFKVVSIYFEWLQTFWFPHYFIRIFIAIVLLIISIIYSIKISKEYLTKNARKCK